MGLFSKILSAGQPAHEYLYKAAKESVNYLAPEQADDSATILECILFSTSYIFITLHNRGIPNYPDFTSNYTKLMLGFIEEQKLGSRLLPDVRTYFDQHMDLYSSEFYALMENNSYLPAKALTAILNPLRPVDSQIDNRVFNPMLSLSIPMAYNHLLKKINDKFKS